MAAENLTTRVNSHWYLAVPFYSGIVYVMFRAACVIINNACVRVLEWQRKDAEKEGPGC